jgi:predicted enzyme related to lactoylglutathione lyase
MQIQYLEIVTPDVDAVCKTLEELQDVRFGDPVPTLGNARTAKMKDGGLVGVRAPMHEDESPVVRPYLLVNDVESATKAAEASGGEIAHPPMELPGHGKFSIYIQGGIQHGLWQL